MAFSSNDNETLRSFGARQPTGKRQQDMHSTRFGPNQLSKPQLFLL